MNEHPEEEGEGDSSTRSMATSSVAAISPVMV
jgi:hypothetical protein